MPLPKTAILINSPESIFLPQRDRQNLFAVVVKNSGLADLARQIFPPRRIIFLSYRSSQRSSEPLSLDFSELLAKTDLTGQLLGRRIGFFCPPYRSSLKMEDWSRKTGIKLLVTPWAIQQKMENKRYFDDLLKKHKLPSPRTLGQFNLKSLAASAKGYVAQEAKASDYFRTEFYDSGRALAGDLKKNKIDLSKTVIREYLPGLPVGVNIFLDKKGNYFFSALRRQCFIYQGRFPKKFIGLQWLPKDFFPPVFYSRLNRQLVNLTGVLRQEGFYGAANVDLVVNRNQPYFLECNPWLSVATPQAFASLGLSGISDPWQFFLRTFSDSNPSLKKPAIPPASFRGSILDMEAGKSLVVKNCPKPGVYSLEADRVKFISSSPAALKGAARFFLFHELTSGQKVKRGYGLGTIFSHWPLFDFQSGKLNRPGEFLNNYFKRLFYD